MSVHRSLREANIARQAEWDPSDKITLAFRGNELGGECGEAQNIIKKLERERLGIRGSRADRSQLAEELADVVICADVIAMAEGIDLDHAVASKFNATSEHNRLETRLQIEPTWPRHRLRIDLAGVSATAIDYLRGVEHPLRGPATEEDKDGHAAMLQQLIEHIAAVRSGAASLADFADFYAITPPTGLDS